jgi:hypothetical protein
VEATARRGSVRTPSINARAWGVEVHTECLCPGRFENCVFGIRYSSEIGAIYDHHRLIKHRRRWLRA